ncbi:MAG TPA: DegV family protein [Clostridia bacterium]|nr:DegV family protein [Clostridia bacterium]
MDKIALVLDTASNMDFEMAEKFGFELLPYSIEIEGDAYDDLIEIPREGFYERLEKEKMSTGVPPLGKIQNFMEKLVEKGYKQALIFTVSPEMSGMYSAMRLHSSVEGLETYVLDTRTVGPGVSLLALYAKDLLQKGYNFNQLIKACTLKRDQLDVAATFRTLVYLIRGGRISSFKGHLGEVLKFFPLISVKDGKLQQIGKARGKVKSQKQLLKKVKADLAESKDFDMAFFHAENPEEMKIIKEELSDEISRARRLIDFPSTSVLGVHGGPGYFGVSYFIRQ